MMTIHPYQDELKMTLDELRQKDKVTERQKGRKTERQLDKNTKRRKGLSTLQDELQ